MNLKAKYFVFDVVWKVKYDILELGHLLSENCASTSGYK
jgi:hypothetical protein